MSEKRDRWPSRTIFIFAAIGSAVGLGNIWRFPYLVGKYGGGAFLFPYLIFLFVFGIPLLILEFSLGQKMQRGAVGAFRKISPAFGGVGVGALSCSFIVACYYAVVMAWSLLYLVFSFNLAWGHDPSAFFFDNVLKSAEHLTEVAMIPTPIMIAFVLTWIMVYFCIWKGVRSVSAVVTVTMPLPILLLFVLLIRGVTLPGSYEGIIYYLTPDFDAFFDPDVWLAAMTQIFFSLTVGVGVMIAYGSYESKKSEIVKTAFIIGISDAAIALLSGFVVFTTLGHMAHTGQGSIQDLAASGPSLAFIVFPKALSLIPGAPFFAIFFFLTLLLLGIDSLFSLVEGITTTLHDHWPKARKEDLTLYVCTLCFFGGLIFTTTAGVFYLDLADHYITSYGLVGVSLVQALIIGWYHGADAFRDWVNSVSVWKLSKWWSFSIRYLAPVFLLTLLCTGFMRDVAIPYGGYPTWSGILMGWSVIGGILFLSLSFSAYFWAKNRQSKET